MAGIINFDALHYTKPTLKKTQVEQIVTDQWILSDLSPPPPDIPPSYQLPSQNPVEEIAEGIGEFLSELKEGITDFGEEIGDGLNAFGQGIAEALEDMADFFKLG